eukprot:TRINITY_DN1009_c0_g1_i1.p1 TRINITY_DN1009_c0_g1~~TRINITY_DN1009_c0_g1_i1.p1  ORF type:complete len:227 (+),score=58.43 TRINITY_DN1009_c0_g1_i1:62-682(+)
MGKGGKSKGYSSDKKAWKPSLKESPWRESANRSAGKSKGKGGGSRGKWVFVEEPPRKETRDKGRHSTKGKSKGSKGKSKGKGKGKPFKAAPLKSQFWERKVDSESRKEIGDIAYPGTIRNYNWKQGWGFIRPDNVASLPAQVKKQMNEAEAAAEASGKEVKEKGLLYFRKPDVNHAEGFKLTSDVSVTFRVYVDEKGAGALDVTQA